MQPQCYAHGHSAQPVGKSEFEVSEGTHLPIFGLPEERVEGSGVHCVLLGGNEGGSDAQTPHISLEQPAMYNLKV